MDKIAVVYKSRYGSTKKYAQWIAEDAKADLYECSQMDINKLMEYDTIIYGGGLYASRIAGVSIITKNYNILKDKRIIVFTVGLAGTENKEIFTPIIEKNFPSEELRESIKFFHLRGGIDYKKLGIVHKSMMAMLKTMLSKKDANELSNEDKELLATYGGKVDFIDRTTIKPLITFLMDKN
ncbi:flavodoxin domain-containing protein [Schnuerera ultunensis]|uniref:flavodoxin domain-containing protein n=1 Tax=Schnuerera ultunensis TaxID=45497 RepID=UPI000412C05C|nr:flavodoxin domain-containing protein [Schnuerera ultunensis]